MKNNSLLLCAMLLLVLMNGIAGGADDPCANPPDQRTMNRCALEKAAKAEDEAKQVYNHLIAKVGANSPEGQKIEAAEAAWSSYKDAYLQACFPHALSPSGHTPTIYPLRQGGIRQSLAKAHIDDLKNLLYLYGVDAK